MAKNAFVKYLLVSTSIIIVSIVILGMLLMSFVFDFWKNEKQQILSKDTQNTADMIAALVNRDGFVSKYSLYPIIKNYSERIKADIIITDAYGVILLSSNENINNKNFQLPINIIDKAKKSEYKELGKLGGLYSLDHYTYGVPIYTNDGCFLGLVLASIETASLKDFTLSVFKIFLISGVLVLFFSVTAISVMTYNMVRPLRKMAQAAHSYAKGDFSPRVAVKGSDEVAQLAMAFNNMAASLDSIEGMRRSFVANVSHELKTPMTTIAGFIDGMLDGTIPKEQHKHYLAVVSEETRRLSRLVRSMLDISRIDSGEMTVNYREFDLNEILVHTLLVFERKINEKNITVKDIDNIEKIIINADPDLIHQLLYNLIDNAVKFTNEGGYIEIKTQVVRSGVKIFIKNSGPGIASDELSSIFDRFYKTDKSRSHDKNGVGLGLFIVKSIIDLHHGEIVVRSIPDKYTEFEIYLPDKKTLVEN